MCAVECFVCTNNTAAMYVWVHACMFECGQNAHEWDSVVSVCVFANFPPAVKLCQTLTTMARGPIAVAGNEETPPK